MSQYFISIDDAESDLLSAAAYLGERINSIDGHAEAMMAVIPRYLAKGNVDLAAELANTIDDPYTRDRLLILVAEKCAELDDDEYALQLADAVEDLGLQSQALEQIGLQKAKKAQFDRAFEIADQMQHPDGVFVGIAVRQAADGLGDEAIATIDKIDHAGAAVTAFIEIASNELSKGNAEKALEYLELAAEEADEIEHTEEKARAFCDIGMGFSEAGRNDRAIETFDRAKATAETLDNIHRDAFLSLAAQGFMHAGSVELADRTLDLVADKTHIGSALLGFARDYWKKDERVEAVEALDEATAILESQHERETRDHKTRFRLFTQIAAQYAGFEKGERGIEVADGIKDPEQRTAALSQVASILTVRNEDDQAEHAYQTLADDGDRVFALIGMSDAKRKNEDNQGSLDLLDKALELAETVPQLISRASAYRDLADRYAKLENKVGFDRSIKQCLEVISSLRDESAKVSGLAALAQLEHDLGIEASAEELGLKTIVAGGVHTAST